MKTSDKFDEMKQDAKTTEKKAEAKLEGMKGNIKKKEHRLSDKM